MSVEAAPPPSITILWSGVSATHPPGPALPQPKITCWVRVAPIVGRDADVAFDACIPGSRGAGVIATPTVLAVASLITRKLMPLIMVAALALPWTRTLVR